MAGWLSRIFGAGKPAAGKAASRQELAHALDERKGAAQKPFVLQAENAAKQLVQRFGGMRNAAEKIRQGEPVETSGIGPAIAKEMKSNFVQRIFPLLEESLPGGSLQELKEFSLACSERMAKIHKINFDNRYLFGLFKKEGELFAVETRKALVETESLRQAVGKAEEAGAPFEKLSGKLALLEEKEKSLEKAMAEAGEASMRLAQAQEKKDARHYDAGALEHAKKQAEEKHAKADAAASRIRRSVSLIERLLRKHAHKAVKKEAEFIRRLAETPLEALKGKEGRQEASRILSDVSKGQEDKLAAEAGKLSGELEALWADFQAALEEKAAAEKSLEPLEQAKKAREQAESDAAEREKEEKKALEKVAQAGQQVEGLKKEIDAEAGELGISAKV